MATACAAEAHGEVVYHVFEEHRCCKEWLECVKIPRRISQFSVFVGIGHRNRSLAVWIPRLCQIYGIETAPQHACGCADSTYHAVFLSKSDGSELFHVHPSLFTIVQYEDRTNYNIPKQDVISPAMG